MITQNLLSAALSVQDCPYLVLASEEKAIRESSQFDGDLASTARKIVTLAAKEALEVKQKQEARDKAKSIKLGFYLSMPSNNSWNNRWSGDGGKYVIIKEFSGKKGKEKAAKLLENNYHRHAFGDGWVAGVEIKELTPEVARKDKKSSLGFCGYNWMVDSIISKGSIT